MLTLWLVLAGNPNMNSIPEPGWNLWRPKTEIPAAGFDSGFSNLELGGYLDFQHRCITQTGLPDEKIEYWFRLSNSVHRMGTGKVEFGCWYQGNFASTYESTAIKSPLENYHKNYNCLRVNSPNQKSLVIRKEASKKSRRLGVVVNNKIVRTDSLPALISEVDGENWVHIVYPLDGWVSDGSFAGQGNLKLCSVKSSPSIPNR